MNNGVLGYNQPKKIKGRGATTLFSDEKQKINQMLKDGLSEEKARGLITMNRKNLLKNISKQEGETLKQMAADGLDTVTAVNVIKKIRNKNLPLWKKAAKIPFNVTVGGLSLVAEQEANIFDFATSGAFDFKKDVAGIKQVTDRSFKGEPGFQAGRNIVGAGEVFAAGPSKIAPTIGGRTVQSGLLGAGIGGATPILEKGAEATAGEIATGTIVGGALGATSTPLLEKITIPAISGTINKLRKASTLPSKTFKKAGESLYKTAIKPSANEAKLILREKAGLGPKIITRADTALKTGLTGTETQLGVKSLKEADKIFKKTIGPALKKSKITHNIDDIFTSIEKDIMAGKSGELRKKELLRGLEALKDDYSTIGKKKFTTQALQIEKSSLDEFTPQKIFKGNDVANGYNQVKNSLANKIRQQVRDDLGTLGVKNAQELYRDYANLTELSKIGIKGLTEGGLKGGFGTFWSTLYDKVATPIKTVGGKWLYKTGEGLEFIGPKGIKTVGDYLKLNNLDILKGNVINLLLKDKKGQ